MLRPFDNRRNVKTIYNKGKGRAPIPEASNAAADVVFISGGLKAALNSQKSVRENVISDVSEALNCAPEDLDFLFEDGVDPDNDRNVFDFPDAERRRFVIRNNFLDAAE